MLIYFGMRSRFNDSFFLFEAVGHDRRNCLECKSGSHQQQTCFGPSPVPVLPVEDGAQFFFFVKRDLACSSRTIVKHQDNP